MELLNSSELFPSQPRMKYFGGAAFARFMMHLLKMKKVNRLYTELAKESGIDFIDKLIETLELKFTFDEQQLQRIPETGPFIIVANHPFGGLDGILMIKIIRTVRPDLKILANDFLQKIKPLNEFFIGIEGDDKDEAHDSAYALSAAHLEAGGALGIFPAGEVSGYDQYYNVMDKSWQYPVIKLIKNTLVPVVPLYFSGSNSRLFNLLGMINPRLKMAKLPSEFFSRKKKEISISIGHPIRKIEIAQFSDIHQLGRFLRAKTYCLGASRHLEVRKFFKTKPIKKKTKVEALAVAIERDLLLQELEKIKADYTLFSIRNYTVYCAPTRMIPNFLNEIGRLREITFREVGEGTNHATDIDEYDLYYHQLFIWDNEESCVVGAYRLGLGNEIIQQYGIHGFYIKSLFRIKPAMKEVLSQSIELGRSFVIKAYQRRPLPLFLLWKGILYFLLKNPEYRYLTGPVSISNNYSDVSKDSIIRFITANYFNHQLARYIRPRKAYQFISEDENINLLLENAGSDLNKFDRIIGDIDKVNNGIPVLLKKYLSLNASILAFNVDPNFNNCLDGLIILDIYDVPQNTIESLSKEVNDGSILERFYSSRELNRKEEQ